METAFAVLGGVSTLVALVFIAYYVFFAIGTYYVLKQLGFAHPWLAWIPIGNSIALGLSIADEDGKNKVFGYSIPNLALALYSVIAIVVSYFPFIGTILSLAVSIVGGGTVYSNVYARMEKTEVKDNYVMGYLSAVIGIVAFVKDTLI